MKSLSNNSFTKGLSLILLFFALSLGADAQKVYKAEEGIFKSGNGQLEFKDDFTGDFKVLKGKLLVRTGFDNGYQFGLTEQQNTVFNITVNCELVEIGGSSNKIPLSLSITNEKPSSRFFLDLGKYISLSTTSTGFTCDGFELRILSVDDHITGGSFQQARDAVGVFIGYEAEYGVKVDLSNSNFDVVIIPVDQTNPPTPRVREFNWLSVAQTCIPAYELQLLRLYNSREYPDGTIPNEMEIGAEVNWNKALSFYVENGVTSLPLTIGEGTGYYVWRVRAIGTYYTGSIANAQNYGEWSAHDLPIDSSTNLAELNESSSNNHVFFFDDPDRNINYSYNRVFSENNKVKEATAYATALQQVRQSQIYLPSKNKTIVTQSILDYSGRPALTTMPVPSGEKPAGYQQELVKTEGTNELYQAKNFDKVENLYNPEKVESTNGAFKYYSDNNNEDTRVPNAEGYPYTRVIYANDGTNRVIEQSGIGETHMVGNQTEGKGRTVKTFYGTPSETELIAVFGDEAPDHQQVLKVITVDQNNTTSISYQNLAGKVIATALTFSDATETLLELDNETEVGSISVEDKITNNTEVKNAFVSSKRLVLPEGGNINLDYRIKCKVLDGLCTSVEVDCNYQVEFRIVNVRTEEVDTFPAVDLSDAPCQNDYKVVEQEMIQTLDPGEYLIEKRLIKGTPSLEESEGKVKNAILPLTDWINSEIEKINCEKQLYEFYNMVNHLAIEINKETPGFPNEVVFDCDSCPPPDLITGEYRKHDFSAQFREVFDEAPEKFNLFIYNSDLALISGPFNRNTDQPELIVLHTPCCVFDFPINYQPDFVCPLPDDLASVLASNPDLNDLTVNENYFGEPSTSGNYPVDFEGYAIAMIHECQKQASSLVNDPIPPISEARDLFKKYMQGWHVEGLFNKMVFKMLTDKYSYYPYREARLPDVNPCYGELNGPQNESDAENAGECAENVRAKIEGTNYYCADLAECWKNSVMSLLAIACQKDIYFNMDSLALADKKIPESVDEQNDQDSDDEGNDFNDHFDDNIKSWFVRFFVKVFLSKKMRNFADGVDDAGESTNEPNPMPKVEFNLVQQFLDCAGYKFADIIDPSNLAYPINSINTRADGINANESCFYSVDYDFDKTNDREYDPVAFYNDSMYSVLQNNDNWLNLSLNLDDSDNDGDGQKLKDVFPHVRNPLYAFKYFEYARGSSPALEVEFCYKDPNIDMCLDDTGTEVNCCNDESGNPIPCDFCDIGVVNCPYRSHEWGSFARLQFHLALINFAGFEAVNGGGEIVFTCDDVTKQEPWFLSSSITTHNPPDINPNPITQVGNIPLISASYYKKINNYTGEVSGIQIPGEDSMSYVEQVANKMTKQCHSSCNSAERRKEFRNEVIRTFEDRCYDLGGCKTSATDNKVPWKDVELIVDKMVEQCLSQCPITTFSCEDLKCRPSNTPVIVLGMSGLYTNLQYGVSRSSECSGSEESEQLGSGPMRKIRKECEFTWGEYTFWNEAKDWKPEMDLPTKCNSIGEWDGVSATHYYDDYGKLIEYPGEDPNCGKPDTFIEKNKYEFAEQKGPYKKLDCDERESQLSQGKNIDVPINQ